MKETLKAIKTAFDANAPLIALFPNGAYASEGKRNAALPNCIVKVRGGSDQVSTGKSAIVTDEVLFTFWVIDQDTGYDAIDALLSCFKEASLTMSNGCSFMRCWFDGRARDLDAEDDDVWQGNVSFSIQYTFDSRA